MLTLVRILGFCAMLLLALLLLSKSRGGSRELSLQVVISNMGGEGVSISVTRLTDDEPEDGSGPYRSFR